MKVIISESAFRGLVQEALAGKMFPDQPLLAKDRIPEDPVEVNPESKDWPLGPDADVKNKKFSPRSKVELQNSIHQLVDKVPDENAEKAFTAVRDALEDQMKDEPEDDGTMTQQDKKLKMNPATDSNLVAGGMQYAKRRESRIRAEIKTIINGLKKTNERATRSPSAKIIKEAAFAYIEKLAEVGTLNENDVMIARDNLKLVTSLAGFNEFLPEFVRIRKES